jgi:hypothetical protein
MSHACCGREKKHTCTSCGRTLCAWHSAGSPVSVDGEIHFVTVCLPICTSPWWQMLESERAKREAA